MSATESTEKVEPALTTVVEPKETLLREKPLDETKPKPKNRIHWQAPFFIVGGLVLAAVLAVTHHFVYKSWDYDVVADDDQQTRYLRIGMMFGFLIETALGAAIGTAFTQVMWQLFRQKSFTVGGIDTVWTSLGDPMSLLSWEFLTKGWLLVVIAICTWALPVISIITPATLSIRLMESATVSSLPVPYINSSWVGPFAEFQPAVDGNDFTGTTPLVSRLLFASATTMQILPQVPPSPNCSYAIQFDGPALKCQAGIPTNFEKAFLATFNTSGTGAFETPTGDESPYLGAGSSIIITDNQTEQFPNDRNTEFLSHVFFMRTDPKNVSCELYDASYDVAFNFSSGVQSTFVRNLTYLQPNIFSHANYNLSDGQNKAAQAMMEVTRSLLTGFIEGSGSIFIEDTNILATSLAGCPELKNSEKLNFAPGFFFGGQIDPWMCRNGSLELAMEDLFTNSTLSLFSAPQLAPATENFKAEVTTLTIEQHYSYDFQTLWITYAVFLAASLVVTLLGLWGLHVNGVASDTAFSTILLTTRNPDLDAIAKGYNTGAVGLTGEVEDVKLRFGVVEGEGRHVAFGREESVRLLKRGEVVE
ncbi:hypothetical protein V500_05281 [Pseudogymnoascus sp. VKM F-4518 (FW-2643)]|nr:hypothetical protein V500_05281 [Pseudogymnoascus sp. VKM F-4518 (FW-2643)]